VPSDEIARSLLGPSNATAEDDINDGSINDMSQIRASPGLDDAVRS